MSLSDHNQPRTDCRAQVYTPDLPVKRQGSYVPDEDATPAALNQVLTRNGIGRALLIQPAFLGTDNSFLLAAIARHEPLFRGVAMLEPSVTVPGLEKLHSGGIRGIRFIVDGKAGPNLDAKVWKSLWPWLLAHGWHVDLHARPEQAAVLWPFLLEAGLPVTLDHFGLPGSSSVCDRHWSGPLRRILRQGESGRVWVKISAAYRNSPPDDIRNFGRKAVGLLLDSFGPHRLLWGSDWPHSSFEESQDYGEQLDLLAHWIPEPELRETILRQNPADLLGRVW